MTYKIHQSVLNHKKIAKSHTHNLFLPQFPCSCSTTSTSSTYLFYFYWLPFFFLLLLFLFYSPLHFFGCCCSGMVWCGMALLHRLDQIVLLAIQHRRQNNKTVFFLLVRPSDWLRCDVLSCENGLNVCLAHSTHIELCLPFIRIWDRLLNIFFFNFCIGRSLSIAF